jgi:thiamine biosynthesis protein ThiS
LAIPRLVLVTGPAPTRHALVDLAEAAVAGGVNAIYLRGLDRMAGDRADLVRELRQRLGPGILLLVNAGVTCPRTADLGLHVRERDPMPADPPGVSRPWTLVGRSVHSAASAAASTGVDYLLAGHVYSSGSKPGLPPLGLETLAAIVAAAPCPVLAIGGITAERVPEVIAAGAHGIAVISAIADVADPCQAASALRAALDRARQDHHAEHGGIAMSEATTPRPTIEFVANGKTLSLAAGATILDFLASKGMTGQMAIVERNGEIVPRTAYGDTHLAPGDRLEVVHAVGGG